MTTPSQQVADATDSAPTQLASLFSGIGGFELGFQQADPTVKIVFSSEIDKYARQIYNKNFGVEPHGDIRKINAADVPDHDILMGGFPCQDVSVTGKREGLCGARSGMFFEIVRILREKQPKLVFLENVRGLISSNRGWDFARILVELENVGYSCEWQVFNSKNHGVPQNRERVFLIGHLRGSGTRQIFPITENNRPDNDVQGHIINTITSRYGQSYATGSYIIENRLNTLALNDPTHSNDRIYAPSGVSPTLNCAEGGNRQPLIICDSGQGRKDQIRNDLIAPLRANTGASHNNIVSPDVTTLKTLHRARRLTPTECERLQGFPDGWTEGISDTVLAPFLGSGTDLEAGRRTNRNVIGFEIDPQWERLYAERSMTDTPPLTSYGFGGDD